MLTVLCFSQPILNIAAIDSAIGAKMRVPTYICVVKLEDALKTTKFENERHRAFLNILYTAWWAKSESSAAMKQFGLTMEQFNVMRILKGKHPTAMCAKDIASRMIERNSNVPRIMDKLVAKNYVKRETSTEDKRETLHSLTEEGMELLDRASSIVRAANDELNGLTEDEAATLNNLLEKLRIK